MEFCPDRPTVVSVQFHYIVVKSAITEKLNSSRQLNRKLTKKALVEIVASYSSRRELSRADNSAYKTILKHHPELLDALKPVSRWTPEQIAAEAENYATRTEWQNEHQTSYAAAIRLNILHTVGPKSRRPETQST